MYFPLPDMSAMTIHQNGIQAGVESIEYRGAEGFQEDNTWHVLEETLDAELDTKIASGPAEIHYKGRVFRVTVDVLHFENEDDDDDVDGLEDEEKNPECMIRISTPSGLEGLAEALGCFDTPPERKDKRPTH